MSSALALLLALASAVSARAGEPYEVVPTELPWERLGEVFDRGACLPETRSAAGEDLVAAMEELVALRFELEPGGDRALLRSFAELAVASRESSGDARREWLDGLRAQASGPLAAQFDRVTALLMDDALASDRWRPGRDRDEDGILIVDAWPVGNEGAPWKNLPGKPAVEQGAALVWADPATFKAVENDYASYARHAGPGYEWLEPMAGSYFRGSDPHGDAFATLRLRIRRDLPFPFGDYSMELSILNRVDDVGRLVTDVYSRSRDFHWLAGRDVFLPVADAGAAAAAPLAKGATLVVRLYGFDLDGVPDSPKHRRSALRGSLGNLKREAERMARASAAAFDAASGVPEFRVRGAR